MALIQERPLKTLPFYRTVTPVIYRLQGCHTAMTCTHLLKIQLSSPEDAEVLRIMRPVYCDDQPNGNALYRGDVPTIPLPDPAISLLKSTSSEAQIRSMIQGDASFYEIADRLQQLATQKGDAQMITAVSTLIGSIESTQELGDRLFPKVKGRFCGISMPSQPSQPFIKIGLVQLNTAVCGVADMYAWRHELPASLLPGTEVVWPPNETSGQRIGFLMQIVQSGSESLPYRLRLCIAPHVKPDDCWSK